MNKIESFWNNEADKVESIWSDEETDRNIEIWNGLKAKFKKTLKSFRD